MSEEAKYTVLGYDRIAVEACEGNVLRITGWTADRKADNIKEAKQYARILLGEAYRVSNESCERLVYTSVHLGGENGECIHDEWNPDYQLPTAETFALRKVVRDLVQAVNSTGGVVKYAGEVSGCVADPEWLDMALVYLDACEALGRRPMIATDDEERTSNSPFYSAAEHLINKLIGLQIGSYDYRVVMAQIDEMISGWNESHENQIDEEWTRIWVRSLSNKNPEPHHQHEEA